MVKISCYPKALPQEHDAVVGRQGHPLPLESTNAGRTILAHDPDCPGSLGIAISEAVEDAATHGDTNYALGCVLNHVCLHQTVIGQEARSR